jgi:hypothetical protein
MILALLSIVSASRADSAPTADLVSAPASGSSCAAPCYVHFDATGTTDSDSDVRPFHDLHYSLDYGDSACSSGRGAWPNSDQRHSKNIELSPIGAHVYECAGSIRATLTVTDSAGATSTDSVTLTIFSEDSQWPGAKTRCVSTSGSWSGCPAGADTVVSSDFDAELQTAAGRRTLYRCGETFTVDRSPDLSNASPARSLIGGYGSCSDDPALVTYAGTSDVLHDADLDGWTIRDLRFTATAASETTSFINALATVVDFLLLRVSTLQVGECSWFWTPATSSAWNERIAFFSYTCTMTVHNETGGWPVVFMSAREAAMVDCSWSGDATDSLWMRFVGMSKFLFAHNRMTAVNGTSLTTQFRSASGGAGRADRWNVISDVRIHDAGDEGFRTIALCWSHDCGTHDPDTEKGDYIIEGIRTTYGAGKAAHVSTPFQIMADRVTIRNNILDMRAITPATNVFYVATNGQGAAPDGIDVYQNTIVRAGSTAGTTVACAMTAGTEHRCRSNLIYDVDDADRSLTSGSAYEKGNPSNNVHLNGASKCPFRGSDDACTLSTSGPTMSFEEFQTRSSGGGRGDVVDAGFDFPEATTGRKAYVYCDAFGTVRGTALGGSDSHFDLGADEYGSAARSATCSGR